MRRFPDEFEALLTPGARRLLRPGSSLDGVLCRDGRRFLALPRFLDARQAEACTQLLERVFPPLLKRMERPIPPQALWGMQENYSELLPKSARVSSAMLDHPRSRSRTVAEALGLVTMLRSESFHRFAELVNGRPLHRRPGVQLLCYGAGDYAGPHNDHHPEDLEARDGYLDVHLTFANAAVARQLLVYERRGHLSEVASVCTRGGLTAYRLPFWHYTTPLEPKRGRENDARRWVLLGTFVDAKAMKQARTVKRDRSA